jgi:hypothetical protein
VIQANNTVDENGCGWFTIQSSKSIKAAKKDKKVEERRLAKIAAQKSQQNAKELKRLKEERRRLEKERRRLEEECRHQALGCMFLNRFPRGRLSQPFIHLQTC